MVTVANLVGYSGKIAMAKPHLTEKITNELLKTEDILITPHLTEECKRVIAKQAIKSFYMFFDGIEQKDKVIAFVERQLKSSRKSLRDEAENFLKKYIS
jgi:predicted nucleotide-binding protein (sugar kinase/HSP70/actin superfamily)